MHQILYSPISYILWGQGPGRMCKLVAWVFTSTAGCFTDDFTLCWVDTCSWERPVLNFQIENYLLRNHETRKYLQEQAYRLQQGIVTSTTQQVRGYQSSPSASPSSCLRWTDPCKSQRPRISIVWVIPHGTVRTHSWKWQQMLSRVWAKMQREENVG